MYGLLIAFRSRGISMNNIILSNEELKAIKDKLPKHWTDEQPDFYEVDYEPNQLESFNPNEDISKLAITRLTFKRVMTGPHTFKWELV